MGVADRKAREFARREREIMDAAGALFVQGSWDEVSVASIAAHADVGKGTIYKHFQSKEELLARLVLEEERALYWKMKAQIPPKTEPVTGVHTMFTLYWERFATQPRFFLLIQQLVDREDFHKKLSSSLREELAATEAAMLEIAKDLLQRGIAQGTFRQQDITTMLSCGIAALKGALQMNFGASSQQPFDSTPETIIRFVLHGWGATI